MLSWYKYSTPDHSAHFSLYIIRCHVLPGTRIITGMWQSYNALPKHAAVNHSLNFCLCQSPLSIHNPLKECWETVIQSSIQYTVHLGHCLILTYRSSCSAKCIQICFVHFWGSNILPCVIRRYYVEPSYQQILRF